MFTREKRLSYLKQNIKGQPSYQDKTENISWQLFTTKNINLMHYEIMIIV